MFPLKPVVLRWAARAPSRAWSSSAAAWVSSWPARAPTTTTSVAASRVGTEECSKDATFPLSLPPRGPIPNRPNVVLGAAVRLCWPGRVGPRGPDAEQSNFPSSPTLQRACRKSEEHHIWGVINPTGTGCSGLMAPGSTRGLFPVRCQARQRGHLWGGGPSGQGRPGKRGAGVTLLLIVLL